MDALFTVNNSLAVFQEGWEYQQYVSAFRPSYDGVQVFFHFPNGYGASLVKHHFSYGNELAMIKYNKEDFSLIYTEITNFDVIGHIETIEELNEYLRQIKEYGEE